MLELINVIKPYAKSISAIILFFIASVTFYYANKKRKEDKTKLIKDKLYQAIDIMGEHDGTISINTDIAKNSTYRAKLETAKRLLEHVLELDESQVMALHYFALYRAPRITGY